MPVSTESRDVLRRLLQDVRTADGYSQPQLAALLGVTVGMLSRWERGADAIPDYRLAQMADILHCPALAADVRITAAGVARRLAAAEQRNARVAAAPVSSADNS